MAGLAAAVLFVALGAGVTYATLFSRAKSDDRPVASGSTTAPAPAHLTSTASSGEEREVVRFELSAPSASRVALVGSFNEWNPVATPLERDAASGKWVVSLRLPPGRHVYAFVVDGDVTADPAAPRAADDDFGSTNSVVLVSSPRS
jgi:1,4-alpha-glucan branching enzyme